MFSVRTSKPSTETFRNFFTFLVRHIDRDTVVFVVGNLTFLSLKNLEIEGRFILGLLPFMSHHEGMLRWLRKLLKINV